jgi:hypothetical protein
MIENLRVQPMDLYADWAEIALDRLQEAGYDVSELTSADDTARAYMNVLLHLTLPLLPRQVHKAADFACPPDQAAGLALFEAKVLAGQPLRPHMSRATRNIDNRDGLLYDWGIHHFHLGTVQQADGFMQRTGPLVYAVVRDEAMYLINVMEHGAWSQQQVLRNVYANWPALLDGARMQGVTGVERDFTDEEVALMRKSNILLALSVAPGVYVSPPGGGVTASGHSTHVIRQADIIQDGLEALQDSIHAGTAPFLAEAIADGTITNPELKFEMVGLEDGGYALYEQNNDFSVPLNGGVPAIPPLR